MVVTRAQFRTSLLHRVKDEIEVTRPGTDKWDFLTDLEYALVKGEPYVDWARKWVGTLVSPHLLGMMEEDADRRVRGVNELMQLFKDRGFTVKAFKNPSDTISDISQHDTSPVEPEEEEKED